MRQRATVRELAAETGLSIATISRVLSGRSNVAPRTREIVLQAVDRLGRRDPRGRRDDDAAICVRCPYPLDDYFGPMVTSIVETVELHGMTAILDAGTARRADALIRLPETAGVRGAVLILPPEPGESLIDLRDQGFPFVVLDPRTRAPRDIVAVSAAHITGARSLMSHLVELGHRRVGIIAGPREWLVTDNRMTGYVAALADAGVLPAPELLRFVEPTVQEGYAAAAQLLDVPERPTALVGFNDKIAVGALRAARERGLRVPEDVSVAGFDDTDISQATEPMLTTVRQPLAELGRMAVTMLIRVISRHQLDARHVELATDLVVRGSTGRAPNS